MIVIASKDKNAADTITDNGAGLQARKTIDHPFCSFPLPKSVTPRFFSFSLASFPSPPSPPRNRKSLENARCSPHHTVQRHSDDTHSTATATATATATPPRHEIELKCDTTTGCIQELSKVAHEGTGGGVQARRRRRRGA